MAQARRFIVPFAASTPTEIGGKSVCKGRKTSGLPSGARVPTGLKLTIEYPNPFATKLLATAMSLVLSAMTGCRLSDLKNDKKLPGVES